MILKLFSYHLRGLTGIWKNPRFTIPEKIRMYLDVYALVIHGLLRILRPSTDAVFRIRSFGVTVRYDTFPAFAYMFNEIFCIGEYPVPSSLATYVDVGANIGLTVLWFKHFYPNANVIAFEPDPRNYALLTENIRANGLTRCRLHQTAVGNKTGWATFYRLEHDIQNLDSGLRKNQDLPHTEFEVHVAKLSGSLPARVVSLLKMDIEGGEYAVFADLFAAGSINRIGRILFESHQFGEDDEKSYARIARKLEHAGVLVSRENGWRTRMNTWVLRGSEY